MTKRAAVILTVSSTILLVLSISFNWGVCAAVMLVPLAVGAIGWAHKSATENRVLVENQQVRQLRQENPPAGPLTSPGSEWMGVPPARY